MLNEFDCELILHSDKYILEISPIVEPALLESAEPSINHSFSSYVQQAANRVIVNSFFIQTSKCKVQVEEAISLIASGDLFSQSLCFKD